MKTQLLTLIGLFLLAGTKISAMETERDTVIIRVGKTQIVIQTNSPEELRTLSQYDLNQMLEDLAVSIDTSGQSVEYLRIDREGEDFIKKDEIESEMREHKVKRYTGDEFKVIVKGNQVSGTREGDYWDRRNPGTINTFDIELGTNSWLEDGNFPNESNAPYSVRPWGSWYVSLGNTLSTSIGGPFFLEWGGNISWYNWKFEDDDTRVAFATDAQGHEQGLMFLEATDVNSIKSKLTASYLNFSFVPMLDFSYGKKRMEKEDGSVEKITVKKRKGFKIGLGAYAGYRLGSKTKFVVRDGGNRDRIKDHDDFYLTNLRYGIRGRIGFGDLDLFVNYDLNDVFAENRGPKMNAFSFGVIF